jgi:hypothetical protein
MRYITTYNYVRVQQPSYSINVQVYINIIGYNNSVIVKCLIVYIICCDHYMLIMFTYK